MDDVRARPLAPSAVTPAGVPTGRQSVAPRAGWRDMWRLLAAPTAGRRVPGTLVVTAGTAVAAGADLVVRDRSSIVAVLTLLAVTVAGTAAYRVAARVALPRPLRLLVVLAVVAVPLAAGWSRPDDALLLAAGAASIAGLAHWATSTRRFSGGELAVFAGIPAALVVLTGSAGLVAIGAGLVFVAGRCLVDRRPLPRTLAMLAGFSALPCLALAAWTWRTGYVPANASWPALWLLGGLAVVPALVAAVTPRSR